jgi:SAM-dependent methyltransferase
MELINPQSGLPLRPGQGKLSDAEGNTFLIVNGVPRISCLENYTENFGIQWNAFDKTQLDCEDKGHNLSYKRFFGVTKWDIDDLSGKDILEVGSGAGRFSRVVLQHTNAFLYSVDYSDAVSANYRNNNPIAPARFRLFQASVYELPFRDNSFDKVFCMGVLQHTPDFDASVRNLISKAKPGGEIVVDFYPINGWWTKINAKYILRPLTKQLSHKRLMSLIESNIDWMLRAERILHESGLGVFARFLPIVDTQRTLPKFLSEDQKREWAVLDTFDMFSPKYDSPQRVKDVAAMFIKHGADVTFAGFEKFDGFSAAVVRGKKRG